MNSLVNHYLSLARKFVKIGMKAELLEIKEKLEEINYRFPYKFYDA